MKNIRLFEGFMDKYYEEITEDEYMILSSTRGVVKFEDWEINKIKSMFGKKWNVKLHPLSGVSLINVWEKSDSIYLKDIFTITITPLPDEYYLVSFRRPSQMFKCDQLDGLKKLLQDKGI